MEIWEESKVGMMFGWGGRRKKSWEITTGKKERGK